MPKSKQTRHEYYANFETCRNRWFDDFEPDTLQNEDEHLNVGHEYQNGDFEND